MRDNEPTKLYHVDEIRYIEKGCLLPAFRDIQGDNTENMDPLFYMFDLLFFLVLFKVDI